MTGVVYALATRMRFAWFVVRCSYHVAWWMLKSPAIRHDSAEWSWLQNFPNSTALMLYTLVNSVGWLLMSNMMDIMLSFHRWLSLVFRLGLGLA